MEVTVDLKTIINKLQACFDRIQKLEEKNEKLVEALKFYANKNTWKRESLSDIARFIIAEDVNEVSGYARYTGGKLARQVLEEIGEE